MRLESDDGAVVELRPKRYQFASAPSGDHDANWLVIAGRVVLADGRSWSFSDPCLLTGEARELAPWLRRVVAGDVAPVPFAGGEDERHLAFLEPTRDSALAAAGAGEFAVATWVSCGGPRRGYGVVLRRKPPHGDVKYRVGNCRCCAYVDAPSLGIRQFPTHRMGSVVLWTRWAGFGG